MAAKRLLMSQILQINLNLCKVVNKAIDIGRMLWFENGIKISQSRVSKPQGSLPYNYSHKADILLFKLNLPYKGMQNDCGLESSPEAEASQAGTLSSIAATPTTATQRSFDTLKPKTNTFKNTSAHHKLEKSQQIPSRTS